jgi:CBS domain-containing protein
MNVASICHHNVVTIRPFDELTSAAELMREQHVGCLIVVEPDLSGAAVRPIGVITDRDIVVAVVGRQTDPRTLRVGDVMTRQPVVVADGDSIEKGLASMRQIGVRRLPVVGNRGQLVGILSLDDILDAISGLLANVAGSIRNEQRIESALRP